MQLLPKLELASTGNTLENASQSVTVKCEHRPSHGSKEFPLASSLPELTYAKIMVSQDNVFVGNFVKHLVSRG